MEYIRIERVDVLKKLKYWAGPISIMFIIFLFSSQPYEQQDLKPTMHQYFDVEELRPLLTYVSISYHGEDVNVQSLGVAGVIDFLIRKMAHFCVFFTLMVATFFASKKTTNLKFVRLLALSFIVTSVYAAFDELHQSLTPSRTPYAGDVILDSSGALAAGVFLLVYYLRSNKKSAR